MYSDSKPYMRQQSANMEDYLETIRVLSDRERPVKVTRISEVLNVTKPSVTAAVAKLAADGLVSHEKYGGIDLTVRGREIADDVCRRHDALRIFLTEILGVPEDTAQVDACRLEHHLSPESSQRLSRFVSFVVENSGGRPGWVEEFSRYLKHPGGDADASPEHHYRRSQRND